MLAMPIRLFFTMLSQSSSLEQEFCGPLILTEYENRHLSSVFNNTQI
jgi:hypothetical protein